MTRIEQMIVAAVHGFLWILMQAATHSSTMSLDAEVIYRMGLILLFVLPAPVMAWKIRTGLDSKEWTRITVRAWLTAAFVIAVLWRIGLSALIEREVRYGSLEKYIFAGMFLLPVCLAFVFWATQRSHKRASYPIRGARRKFGTKTKTSNSVPFSGEMGTRL